MSTRTPLAWRAMRRTNMSGKTIILCITLMLFSVPSKDSVQAQTRTTRPNDVGIELGGKMFLGSLSYQRMITPLVGLQVGFWGVRRTSSGMHK